ncbi:MAG: ornithine cyclodeaminase family protein [Clostridiales bacterium]|nr:ornithine cyclodeaminase family protein [Clostridiales bacterium]
MLFIDRDEVLHLLSPKDCIQVMRQTLMDLENGCSEQYLRTVVHLPQENILGLMPAWLSSDVMGAKIITVFHKNSRVGLPSHQGLVLLFDSRTGSPLCIADGNAITQVRTGAVSAVATDLLARQDASHAAFLGAGAQARSHLAALMVVRELKAVSVYDQNPGFALAFAGWAEESFDLSVHVASTVSEAAKEADIICTLTPSPTPILFRKDVQEGTHINAVGACTAKQRELDSELVLISRFFGDRLESVIQEAGDFLIPLSEGVITREHFLGELGQLLCAKKQGRISSSDITVFESLGLAVEDLAAAYFVYSQKCIKT